MTTALAQPVAITLTPEQSRVFDDLLSIGTQRPTMPADLADQLAERISSGTADIATRWKDSKVWLTKSTIGTTLRCEGQLVANAASPTSQTMHAPTAVGIVAHKAIQIAHTHPARGISQYVDAALEASLSDGSFAAYWHELSIATQSDLISQMVSKTTSFLDSFPPLDSSWVPRFEEPIQARLGKLVLSARPDFTLGRPRADLRQSMFLADMKTGSLNDEHFDEAMFYALVATLRYKVAPFRSVVYSLASGEWTDPDVTPERLMHAADRVVLSANTYVDVLTERREAELRAGRHCTWCPARTTCPAVPETN